MATALRKLKIRRVALVDKGANQEAFVTLFKRDDAQEVTVDTQDTETPPAEVVAKADHEAALAKAEAEKAAIAERANEAIAKADALAAELAKRDEAIEIAKYEADAKALPILGEEGGRWLRTIAKALGEQDYAALHGRLSGVVKQVEQGGLFKELGSNGDGDATSPAAVANGMAEAFRKADPTLTREQALVKAYETPEYRAARKLTRGGK